MSTLSVGDLSQAFQMRRQTAQIKADLQRYSSEVTTGRTADLSRQVGGDFSPIAGVERALKSLEGHKATTTEATTFTAALQIALETVQTLGSNVASGMLLAAGTQNTVQIRAAGNEARQRFDSVIQTLNIRVADRTLLAGVATDGPALAPAADIIAALQIATAGAVTSAGFETAVSTWFNSPSGFAAVAYKGAVTPLAPFQIGPSDAVSVGVTGNDPALRDLLSGLAMAALVGEGAFAAQPAEQARLANRAAEKLLSADGGFTALRARVGSVEARIDEAATRNEAERSTLQLALLAIVEVDPYAAASKLEETQTQLETLYTITARLSRLSLADLLR